MKNVLVTRPKTQATRTLQRLAELGLQAMLLPLFEIKPVVGKFVDTDYYNGLILTSQNALSAAFDMFGNSNWTGLCYVVGHTTSVALQSEGFRVTFEAMNVNALLKHMTTQFVSINQPVLYLRGHKITTNIVAALRAKDIVAEELVVYQALPRFDLPSPLLAQADVVLFYSSQAACLFTQLINRGDMISLLRNIIAIAISTKVAQELQNLPFLQVLIAPEPTEEALLSLLCKK